MGVVADWWEIYKEFDKIVNKTLDQAINGNTTQAEGEQIIQREVDNLYAQHKGEPVWDEAYRRWCETLETENTNKEEQ